MQGQQRAGGQQGKESVQLICHVRLPAAKDTTQHTKHTCHQSWIYPHPPPPNNVSIWIKVCSIVCEQEDCCREEHIHWT